MSYFEFEGTKLFYEVFGPQDATETVLMLNGVMASTNSWYQLVKPLEALGLRVVLHDFMGQTKSDKPEGPYTFNQHITQMLKLCDSLDIEKFHIIGTSYGSEVGMKCAIDYPDKVHSLTLIDGVSEIDEVTRRFIESWKRMCDYEDPYDFFWGMAPSIYGNDFLVENHDFLETRAKDMRNIDPSYFEGQKILYDTFLSEVDFTDELNKITCPTSIIVGEDDLLKRVKFSRIIAKEIESSEFYILPNCGHVAIFEKVEELKSLITGFLQKII